MIFTYVLGASFKNLNLFYHKFSFSSNTTLRPLLQTLYALHIKLFAEASEFFKYAVFYFVIRKNTSLKIILQTAKKIEVGGCKIGTVEKMRAWSIFLFRRTLRIRCFNFCNICKNRPEFIVAHLFKNSVKDLFTLQ